MKKILSILLCISLLLQNFIFLTPVFALGDEELDNNEPLSVNITQVIQDGNILEKDNGVYIANSFNEVSVEFTISGDNQGISTYYIVDDNAYNYHNVDASQDVYSARIPFDGNEINNDTIKICTDFNCNEILASFTMNVKFTRYDELKDSRLYFTSITQNGNNIGIDGDNCYVGFNNRQTITFNLVGENLIDDMEYRIYTIDYINSRTYLGSELEAGVQFSQTPTDDGYVYYSMYFYGSYSNTIPIMYNEELITPNCGHTIVENVPYFNTYLKYTNYEDQIIDMFDLRNTTHYIINSMYHDSSNPLSYHIDGTDYLDEDYHIEVSVSSNGSSFYSISDDVNGLLLNEGYDFVLENINLNNHTGEDITFYINISGIDNYMTINYFNGIIDLLNIRQKDETLQISNGLYLANHFSDILFNINIDNYNNENYFVRIANRSGTSNTGFMYVPGNTYYAYTYNIQQFENYVVLICDDSDCNRIYYAAPFTIEYVNYDAFEAGIIYYEDIYQNGNRLEINPANNTFRANNRQTITFRIKGENLLADEDYWIDNGSGYQTNYLGSDIEAGIEYTYSYDPEIQRQHLPTSYRVGNTYKNIGYYNGNNYIPEVTIRLYEDENLESSIGKLIYTNYKDIEISKARKDYQNEYYYLHTQYFNEDNSLSYHIDGTNFSDKDYSINVVVKKDNNDYYSQDFNVNGLLLNEGYDLELEGLLLDSILTSTYSFVISVNGVDDSFLVKYSDKKINVIKIMQGENDLEKLDGKYIAPGFNNIKVLYSIDGYNEQTDNLMIELSKITANSGVTSYSMRYTEYVPMEANITFEKEYETYMLSICESWQCDTIYDTYIFEVDYTKYNDVKDSRVYYESIKQANREIAIDENNNFRVNDKQIITYKIKGENLLDDETYWINTGNGNKTYYLGSGLEEGIEFEINPTKNYISSIQYGIGDYSHVAGYYLNDEYLPYVYISSYTDENLAAYEATLKYTDNDTPIEEYKINYNEKRYLIDKKYYNEDKPLLYHIEGNDYLDEDYHIEVSVSSNGSSFYSVSDDVNGLLLNEGYDLELADLDITDIDSTYTFNVLIDGITKTIDAKYTNRSVHVSSIKQGDETLSLEGGKYIANGFEEYNLYADIDDYDNNKDNFYINIYSDSNYGNGGGTYYPDNYIYLGISNKNKIETYHLLLCDDYECNKIYAATKFKIELANYDNIANGKVYITDIYQGGNRIDIVSNGSNYYFNFNNKQDITFTIKGENLIDDAIYTVEAGGYDNHYRVTGSELEKGISSTYLTSTYEENNYFGLYFSIGNINLDKCYYDGETYYQESPGKYFYFNFNNQIDESYEANLIYTNYPDETINLNDDEYWKYYLINSNYHNNDNPLSFHINGDGYSDKDYDINVFVREASEEYEVQGATLYDESYQINGILLNDGYDLEIEDLVLSLITEPNMFQVYTYEIYISIDGVTKKYNVKYNSVGRDVTLHQEMFFENGKKNLSAFRGIAHSGFYDTNKDVFEKFNNIYINYTGSNFNPEEEYDYVLEYGYANEDPNNFYLEYEEVVYSGKITGEELNGKGKMFALDNHNNYNEPSYRFMVKKGDEILEYIAPVLDLQDKATLANASLSANNRDLYLRMDDYSYFATRNVPLDVEVSGIGFVEDRDYQFELCYSPLYDNDEEGYNYGEDDCSEIYLNGHELNTGTTSIHLDVTPTNEVKGYTVYIMGYGDDYFGQGVLTVNYVESEELFPEVNQYIIGDAGEIIKNIHKNTNVEEFKSNLSVASNGSIKVFDKTGTIEITGQIGTGMIGRVLDEYDRSILDIDIAVKGDTTGDGNITITDLVKVKKHLLDTEELAGAYEVAGNVTNSGEIGPTDLVKMARDVANIEELD